MYRDAIEKAKSTGKFLDGSRICQGSIKKGQRKGVLKKRTESVENLSRICRRAVELEEKEFFKDEKHKEINATSKLLNQRSNQNIKLSKLNSK